MKRFNSRVDVVAHRLRRVSIAALIIALPVTAFAQASSPPVDVHIAFRGMVGSAPFACGRTYTNIGRTKASIEATDFKFYVHDVRLVRTDGQEVQVELTQDGLWQSENVALLDFEDRTGGCANGTEQTHLAVDGRVPAGTYNSVRFTLGVPFDRNHRDLTAQPSPLSLTRMFWVWNAGYKFLRLDLKTNGAQTWMVHLGSTGCTPNEKATTVPTRCESPNRVAVALNGFDVTHDAIVIDVAELLNGADVTFNQPKTASGCMSGPTDNDCAPLFAALGLPFGSKPAGTQRIFRVERGGGMASANGAAPHDR